MNTATQMEISPEANSDWINASSDEACRLHDAAVDAYGGARIEEAEGLFRRALRMLERVEGENHPDVARVLNNLAAIYEDRCEYEAAERLYQRSVRIMDRPVGDGETEIIRLRLQSWQNLGRIHQAQGRYDQAEPLFKQALALSEQAFGNQGAEMAQALNRLGELYQYPGRFTEGGGLDQRAVAIFEHAGEPDHLAMAEIYHNLGRIGTCVPKLRARRTLRPDGDENPQASVG